MKMKTEMGVMFLQAKEHKDCQSHHKLGQRPGTCLPSLSSEGTSAAGTSIVDFQPSES